MYNDNDRDGHPGLMYNAVDNDNYDFVYFRYDMKVIFLKGLKKMI